MTVNAKTYDIEAVRTEWVGKIVGGSEGRYPVEYDPIRRACHMVKDTNPLFLDPEYARNGPYGAVICPPSLVSYFAGNGPWPPVPVPSTPTSGPYFALGVPVPGDRGINMSIGWEFLEPVRVGDTLRSERVISNVFIKPIRLDPMAVWIQNESRIMNQHGRVVAIGRNTVLVHRSPEQIESDARNEFLETKV